MCIKNALRLRNVVALLVGCVATVPACSSSSSAPSSSESENALNGKGRLDLSLTLPDGATLSTVKIQIFTGGSATGTPIIDRDINVSAPGAILPRFRGHPHRWNQICRTSSAITPSR